MLRCSVCSAEFSPSHRLQTLCSERCRNARREQSRNKAGRHWVRCDDCGKTVRKAAKSAAKQRCADCRLASIPAPGTRMPWIPMRRRLSLYERDGWECVLCGEAVDRDLIGTRSQMRPSLDHVIPRCMGGSHEDSNLRLAHVICNARKGARDVQVA